MPCFPRHPVYTFEGKRLAKERGITMASFVVAFRLSGEVEVECDDEDDARDWVSCLPPEQLVLWSLSRQHITLDRHVTVTSVAASGRADLPNTKRTVCGRRY